MLLNEDTPRNMWQMSRLEQVIPSDDELVRPVQVKTSMTSSIRPISKICPLESVTERSQCVVSKDDIKMYGGKTMYIWNTTLLPEVNHYICTICTVLNFNSLYEVLICQLTFRPGLLFAINALWFIYGAGVTDGMYYFWWEECC